MKTPRIGGECRVDSHHGDPVKSIFPFSIYLRELSMQQGVPATDLTVDPGNDRRTRYRRFCVMTSAIAVIVEITSICTGYPGTLTEGGGNTIMSPRIRTENFNPDEKDEPPKLAEKPRPESRAREADDRPCHSSGSGSRQHGHKSSISSLAMRARSDRCYFKLRGARKFC